MSIVMVTSGYPWSNGSSLSNATRKTEIVDVVNGLTCSDLAELPFKLYDAVGANLGGTPVICGGYHDMYGHSKKCYRFKNSAWEEFASMKRDRYSLAAVVHNDKLHVFGGSWTGGFTNYSYLQTTEIINVDGEVSYGPALPTAVTNHAMTKINDTVSILSGGRTNTTSPSSPPSAKTWYYNHDTEAFTPGPDLLEGRRGHNSATNVDKVTKAKVAVVAGGYNGASTILDSTELLINGQWQTGTIQCRKQKCFDLL